MTQIRSKPELKTARVFAGLTGRTPRQARHLLFEQVTGLDSYGLDALLIGGSPVPPDASGRMIALNLGSLLGVQLRRVLPVLGVSESTLSRQPQPSRLMIDRAYSVVRVFAQVAQVLTPDGARHWLVTPNPALEGEAPFDLLSTRYGEEKVQNMLLALLNGAVL